MELLFHTVLAAPPELRPTVLEHACQGDAALMAEVLSLLEASRAEQELAAQWNAAARAEAEAPAARWIGPYQLDRLLGRGGMGAVYLAHRDDGQFHQQVAIKLVDLPLATDLLRERFRQERQILAELGHPYIARLLDGGVTEDGELYLAMEYVDGVALERYCREQRLTVRERLQLFRKVCAAVQFAHQHLVVHRDLKSDNILVLADGTPKLLDFGTAKLLAPLPAPASSDFTRFGLQAFTPGYASPEQVLGEAITTSSDTYSLGVLLFLLLAGVPPYVFQEGTLAELLRVVCTEPPPKPSACARGPERLDADLDAIVLKALRKEPGERYRSVDALAADLQAYLDGRPVLARQGTLRYRAAKFVGRNKLALGAGVLLAASVLAGMAGVLWQFRVATLERRRAEARSQDMRQLSRSLLSEIDEAVKQLPGSTPVRRLLVERVLEHLDRMGRDPGADRLTRLDLVEAYTRLGNLQGNPYDPNIGDPDGALRSLRKACDLAEALRAGAPGDPAVLGPLALAEQSRSEVLFGVGRTQEAVTAMRAAVAAFSARAQAPGATAAQLSEASAAYGSLGDQLGQSGVPSLGDPEGALKAYRQALELAWASLRLDPGFLRSRRAVAVDQFKLGNILVETDPAQAIDAYHAALAAWEALPAPDRAGAPARRGAAHAWRRLGLALTEVQDYPGALAAFRQARTTFEGFAAADPKDTRALLDLGVELSNEAEPYLDLLEPGLNPQGGAREATRRSAQAMLDRAVGVMQRLVAIDPHNQGWVDMLAHEQVLACSLRQTLGPSEQDARLAASALATLCASAARSDASLPTLDHAVSALLVVLPKPLRDPGLAVRCAERLVASTHRRKPDFLLALAQAYRAAGLVDDARATAKEGLGFLPPARPGAVKPRVRRMLEGEA